MVFELETALRFLRPQKTQRARTLIALSSLSILSVVTWLLLVFYSVTEGLEKRWLDQLIQVTGSLRIVPTPSYFEKSDFLPDTYGSFRKQPTTLIDKIEQPRSGLALLNETLPESLQEEGNPLWERASYKVWKKLEPYPRAVSLVSGLQLTFTQFQKTTSLEKGFLENSLFVPTQNSFFQQNGYLMGLYPTNEPMEKLIQQPDLCDLQNLLTSLGQPALQEPHPALERWFQAAKVAQAHLQKGRLPLWKSEDLDLLWIDSQEWSLDRLCLPCWNERLKRWMHSATLTRQQERLEVLLPAGFALIDKAELPAWSFLKREPSSGSTPVVAAVALKSAGLRMGALLSLKKETLGPLGLSCYEKEGLVVGFYDSGLLPLGGSFFISDHEELLDFIEPYEKNPHNEFFQVWPKDPNQAARELRLFLEKESLQSLFTVESYEDFAPSQELITQLRSDRLLLSLLAGIILLVASSSVCTMMLLLVNERRKEIAIFKIFGMSSFRIASCFAISGLLLGALGAFLGLALASATLYHLDSLVALLSKMQGAALLHPAYYGKHLPNTLSIQALKLALGGNLFFSLLASTLAAWHTSKMRALDLLRSL